MRVGVAPFGSQFSPFRWHSYCCDRRMRFITFAFFALLTACNSHGGPAGPDASGPDASDSVVDSGVDSRSSMMDGTVDSGATLCEARWSDIEAWLDEHAACERDADCIRVDAPILPGYGPNCTAAAISSEASLAELQSLSDAYSATCGSGDSCGAEPGRPRCVASVCSLVDTYDDCLACFEMLEAPVCTTSGLSAFNACAAETCFEEDDFVPGFCPTGPTCGSTGGECRYSTRIIATCPDGQRHDVSDQKSDCEGGNYSSACCRPWDGECTFFGGATMQLTHDPFTCEPTRHCLSGVQPDSCQYSGNLQLRLDMPLVEADITITARTEGEILVEGDNRAGRTFRCEGEVADFFGPETSWTCEACNGSDCESCEVAHTGGCE